MARLWPSTERRLGRLVHRTARGDTRAFRVAYRELHPLVHGYVARRIADATDAEDLTARVFHRMVENLASYDPRRGGVRAWVLTMARNAVIDHLRTRKEHASIEVLQDELADASLRPLEALELDERARRARALLDAYPAEVREMFALRYGDGLRLRQIAELLGTSEAAIKQRFSRTLRELRERSRKLGLDEEVGYAH